MKPSEFQFSNPVLTNVIFTINDKYDNADESPTEAIPIRTELSANKESDNSAIVSLKLDVADENVQYPFYISATMTARFRWDESISPQNAEALINGNAAALLLGYLRPLVAHITEASPVNTVHIPFINFFEEE